MLFSPVLVNRAIPIYGQEYTIDRTDWEEKLDQTGELRGNVMVVNVHSVRELGLFYSPTVAEPRRTEITWVPMPRNSEAALHH